MSTEELARKVAVSSLSFGLLIVVGGAIGYISKGSFPSLLSGLILGNVLILGSLIGTVLKLPKLPDGSPARPIAPWWGYWTSTIAAVAIVIFFIMRLLGGAGAMPGALIVPLGLIVIAANLYVLNNRHGQA